MMRRRAVTVAGAAVLVLSACTSAPSATTSTSPTVTTSVSAPSSASSSGPQPGDDLAAIDDAVRHVHADAFAAVPEATWARRVAELRATWPGLEPDQRVVGLAGLAGLLDTHTQFFPTSDERIFDAYLYRFPEGLYVVAADDASLVGSRLLAVGTTPVTTIEPRVRGLIPGDNQSARDNNIWVLGYPDYLHGLGFVSSRQQADFEVLGRDGRRRTATVGSVDIGKFSDAHQIRGSLAGDATEAVRRRGEPLWSRVDTSHRAFLLSLNDYTGDGVDAALASMTAALRAGTVNHVVIDMRYLRGGNPTPFLPIVSAVAADPHLRTKAALTVLIGRENESAGTVMAEAFDTQTAALMVGEPTPAMADNFLCPCTDVPLPISGYTFSVPTTRAGNGDARRAVVPDVLMRMTAADFFAGRDKVLVAALTRTFPK